MQRGGDYGDYGGSGGEDDDGSVLRSPGVLAVRMDGLAVNIVGWLRLVEWRCGEG